MPIIINPIFTKDFPPLGRDLLDSDIIVIAVPGDQITYRSTVGDLRSSLSITFTGETDTNGQITATTGTDRLIAVYEGDNLVRPEYNRSTKVLSGLNQETIITAYFI